jgi:hypothetical protein
LAAVEATAVARVATAKAKAAKVEAAEATAEQERWRQVAEAEREMRIGPHACIFEYAMLGKRPRVD